ncbi:MAG: signal peptide peptidase SppA [Xanthomonadales bacterium]|nr:signal peptide peptidase SppA [Xanthomonadales bacterium]
MSNVKRPGPVRRTLVASWRVLDFSRRFILTIAFLLLVAVLLAAMFRAGPQVGSRTALVIEPVGVIVEEYTMSPLDRMFAQLIGDDVPEVQLRDLIRALDAAADDQRIERVVLRLHRLIGGGVAGLRDIGAAIERVKASGKEVIAYGDAFTQDGYYLASRANQVYMDPMGMVLLEGFGRYRLYYAEALAKLGVEAHLFRVGEFKSAGEPYIRNDASAEAREADLYWIGDLWRQYLADIGAARQVTPESLQTMVQELPALLAAAGGDLPALAQQAGLVDRLLSWPEVERELIQAGVADEDGHSFRQVDMGTWLTVLERERKPATAPVAIVVAQGAIVSGDPGLGVIGGDAISGLLRQARENDDIKAVVLRIDSPGGQAFPSEQIRREISLLREAGKPVVASMGDVAASGGYWIAMQADQIIADPATITGSIGVFGLWLTASEGLAKLGLNSDGVGTTWVPAAFDPTQEYDPRMGQVIQGIVDDAYRQFIDLVASARGVSAEAIDEVARGRVWSGGQALERGLVDELGGLVEAIAKARSLAGLDADAGFTWIERELSSMDRFLAGMGESALVHGMHSHGLLLPASWLPTQARDDLRQMRELLRQRNARGWGIYADCQCGLYLRP